MGGLCGAGREVVLGGDGDGGVGVFTEGEFLWVVYGFRKALGDGKKKEKEKEKREKEKKKREIEKKKREKEKKRKTKEKKEKEKKNKAKTKVTKQEKRTVTMSIPTRRNAIRPSQLITPPERSMMRTSIQKRTPYKNNLVIDGIAPARAKGSGIGLRDLTTPFPRLQAVGANGRGMYGQAEARVQSEAAFRHINTRRRRDGQPQMIWSERLYARARRAAERMYERAEVRGREGVRIEMQTGGRGGAGVAWLAFEKLKNGRCNISDGRLCRGAVAVVGDWGVVYVACRFE